MRLNRLWTTVDGAIADLGDSSRDRRANAGAWVWGRGYDRFSADERHRLVEALQPVAEADPDPAARAQAIAALVGLRVDGSVDLALAALRDPDWGMRMCELLIGLPDVNVLGVVDGPISQSERALPNPKA